jgi:putative membrane-bound dehydrogenase-like protein
MSTMRMTLPLILAALQAEAFAAEGNRLAYLDGPVNPYYVYRGFPKLITPQWVGEDGVEAVVVLAIDDMMEQDRYEKFLRPILERLKRIDGRAPVSIMTNKIDPQNQQLQKWLKEGLSLETHTFDHPCPFFNDGNFAKAKSTYERCVDLLASVPNSKPVAFRMPCCDSLNTPTPRFYAEIFNKTTSKGHYLHLDSSVFNLITANDPDLPRDLVLEGGVERFRKYLPADRSFVNYIEDYPFPYVLGGLCWQFPCAVPSDWESFHLHKSASPIMARDWRVYLDATVIKQGVMSMVFHPHGWSTPGQFIDLIDHAVAKHGKKVKFLTFRECHERLEKNLLGGHSLRDASKTDAADNGVRLLDLNGDGFLDVVIANSKGRHTRVWSPKTRSWVVGDFPIDLTVVRGLFGTLDAGGQPLLLANIGGATNAWRFGGNQWVKDPALARGLETAGASVLTSTARHDRGERLRDVDGDGRCELIIGNEKDSAVYAWAPKEERWRKLPYALPAGTAFVDKEGRDAGLRQFDLDEDGALDVISSNEEGYSIHLFESPQTGWARTAMAGKPGERGALPMIARGGRDNGAWFHSRHLWVQNENTAALKDHVDRRSFNELLAGVDPRPKSPAAALRSLRARSGFVAELVVSEPLVQDPIAFAFGPDGKLWVVEMGDYPLGVDGKGKAGGQVRLLESTHNDGKYDKVTIFLDNLPFPTGVMPWRKGVLVTCAPDILYAEDTDGDGKADLKTVLFTGFIEGNQQHRVNGLMWGLDNWIYGANGESNGRVKSIKTGQIVDIRGRDFRLRPDDGAFDTESGGTQYGRCCDDWGNWFGGNNSNPLWYYPLAEHYVRRNPNFAPPDARVNVPAVPGASPVFPISRTLPRFNDLWAANRFTSACSPIIYRDELFGSDYAGNAFICEPVHNLVHREVVSAQGTTFRSRRAADERESEFLASSDNWFRPTMVRVGPDGALWVADMYRQTIEHPEWIPKDWQKKLDLRAGHDMGRIYRVYPVGGQPRAIPRLDRLDTAGLVAALDSPSGWQRDMAQQMLLWRDDRSAVGLLEKLATNSARPQARLHALCSLDGIHALAPGAIKRALDDPHPGVRRHAVRLCEALLSANLELGDSLLKRIGDDDAQVQLQLAYTLGTWPDPRAGRALGELAVRHAADPYFLAAVMSSVHKGNLSAVLLAALASGTPPSALVDSLLRQANAVGDAKVTAALLGAVGKSEGGRHAAWQFTAMGSFLDSLDQRNSSLADVAKDGDAVLQETVKGLNSLFGAARKASSDGVTTPQTRAQALRLLGRGLDLKREDLETLAGLLVPQSPEEVQSAAVAALGRLRGPKVPEALLRGWKGYGPALRAQALEVLLRREEWTKGLIDALDTKLMATAEIDAPHRQRLLDYRDVAIRQRAAKLFAGSADPDRQKIIDSYQGSIGSLKGEVERGKAVFIKSCSACHRLAGVGNEVGPDLAALGGRTADYLLTSILDPNRAVEARYVNYQAETKNGLVLTGVLASESATSITLLGPDGKPQVVLRKDLESLTSTGKSAMPEGLEKDVRPQDMADLLAYLKAATPKPQRKLIEGNTPQLIQAAPDGSLRLAAANAEIYGKTLVLELQYGNLGYWSSQDDHAAWTVRIPRSAKYSVWFDFACDANSAGNGFVVETDDGSLSGYVASTGDWDTYRRTKVGELTLKAGERRIVLRPEGKINGALMDLKNIRLVPVPGS